ncbi:unnamed protein product [marine sediment metagenome]|uniref:Uncharacterized protein n=1 Tax=marine sediment metagenome TaxID=412755 RepID=X1E882_9ZZZZ
MKTSGRFLILLGIVFQSFNSNSQALINSFEQESNLANVTVTEGLDISRVMRGEVVSINFNVVEKEISHLKSVARINVYDPDGKYIQYYSSNGDITYGSGSYSFQTAMNDLPGTWKI